MATASLPELQYYRGQYRPESVYQQAGASGGSDIISMYNPQVMNQYIEAVGKRQERYDVGSAGIAQEKARIGEMETYDISGLNERLKSFESTINDTVKNKYNGDYGAAANEIARMIGTERTNPWYHFNKQKVEMGKAYLDTKMKLGANFMTTGSPFDVSFEDWQNGKTFEFTPIDKNDIVKTSQNVFQNLAKMVTSDSGLASTAGGQYFKNMIQYGIKDPAELDEFLASAPGQSMIKEIYSSMPEIANIGNQEAVKDAIRQGAYSAIGTTETKYMADQSYLDALQQSRIKGASGGQGKVVPLGYIEGPKNAEGNKTSIPIYGLNRAYGTTSAEASEMNNNIKGLDEYLSKSLAKGDVVGLTPKDSKLLKDIDTKELISFSLVPTTNVDDPYELVLNIMGTPAKTKNNRTPVPIPISTKVLDPADKVNLFTQLSLLDHSVFTTYMDQLKTVNPIAFAKMTEMINKAKTE